jgi:Tfp pilus assembly PilM family ATPase
MAPPTLKLPQTPIGISITPTVIEAAVFTKAGLKIDQGVTYPLPEGVLSPSGDEILDPQALVSILGQVFAQTKAKKRIAHVSIPGTLLRMNEMLRMSPKEMYVSLSSEAERYKVFDNTEAVVDFLEVNVPGRILNPNMLRTVFCGVRKDTLVMYRDVFQKAKIKMASLDLEPLNVLRGMAGSLVLDSLVQQIGPSEYWGVIFIEKERVRLSIWQSSDIIELREVQMATSELSAADPNSFAVADLVEEIERTSKSARPQIWLTYNMPGEMDAVLSERLQVPVRPCFVGPSMTMDAANLSVAAVGCSMRSEVPFPFSLDLTTSQKRFAQKGKSSGTAAAPEEDENPQQTTMLMVGGGVCLALVMAVYLLLLGVNQLFIQSGIGSLTADEQSLGADIAQVKYQIDQSRGNYDLQAFTIDVKERTKIRNTVLDKLVEDLRTKTPANVWISHVKVDDDILMEGKALEHQSVLAFAKSFDTVPYAGSIVIDQLKEGFVGSAPVYEYKIKGKVRLAPELLKPPEVTSEEVSSDGTLPEVVAEEGGNNTPPPAGQ